MSRDIALELIEQIRKRRDRGIATYGVPVNPDAESVEFWLQNAIEEGIDGVQYEMAALECVKQMRQRITDLEEKLAVATDRIRQLEGSNVESVS